MDLFLAILLSGNTLILLYCTYGRITIYTSWVYVAIMITSTSDIQPSTAIANQLPGQLVSIQKLARTV